jgi:hypothetical protein
MLEQGENMDDDTMIHMIESMEIREQEATHIDIGLKEAKSIIPFLSICF